MRPGGRNPLSRSSSHSWPREPGDKEMLPPGAKFATAVLRQKRRVLKAEEMLIVSALGPFTEKRTPATAFSGRPPSPGGLKRGSRQVPVHVGGSAGSITALAWVSL